MLAFVLYLWLANSNGEPRSLPVRIAAYDQRSECQEALDKWQRISGKYGGVCMIAPK